MLIQSYFYQTKSEFDLNDEKIEFILWLYNDLLTPHNSQNAYNNVYSIQQTK